MSVRFILGRPGTGKTESCMKEARSLLEQDPAGPPLIYLVPDHMTFDTEYAFAKTPGLNGMTRLNVYGIPRLALRVLQRAGGLTRYHLNQTGVTMLLRKIVEQKKDKFRLFRKASEQNGFYSLLSETLTEFKRYCLTPKDVARQADSQEDAGTAESLLLKDKLHDLATVYGPFEDALSGKYVESEDYLRLMADKLAETDFLRDTEIWVDGFQTMTPEEQLVVGQLMQSAKRVTIVLGIDRVYDHPPDEFSVFRHPALLFLQLLREAKERNVEIEPFEMKKEVVRTETPALQHLVSTYGQTWARLSGKTEGLVFTEAVNRREEVEQVARDILLLTRDRGYRFRDITVLVRNLENYQDLIETVFSDYGIPVFVDQKRPMRHHPLIEFIRSAIEAIRQNWRYEPVFRCIKTDLLLPVDSKVPDQREAMDELENYVIAYGIRGKKWTDNEPWIYRTYRGLDENHANPSKDELNAQRRINKQRRMVAAPLASFEKNLKSAASVREKCTAVYQFLIDCFVPEKLERLTAQAEDRERLKEAKEHGQVWQSVLDMLDQCVEGAGDEDVSLDLFSKIIDSGLDSLEFAMVPPAMDQVLAGSLDRMRSSKLRAVFILGMNEGVIPANPREQGLFSDDDRDLLETRGMHVAENGDGQMAGENELIYRAFSLPKEKLFLSCPLASEDGEALTPSPLINRLQRMFPDLSVRLSPSEPRTLNDTSQLGFINGPRKTMGYLASQIRDWKKGYKIAGLWWDVYNWFTVHTEWKGISRKVMESLFSQNEARLSPETAHILYGETIQASVSRMEMFSACPFSQFAAYGLNLREREVFQLAAPDIGQLFHMAMKRMTEKITIHHRVWSDLSPSECDHLAQETVNELAPRLQRQILTSSNRYHYLQHKLEQVVARVAQVMRLHAKASGFSPISLELPFGRGKSLPPLSFSLPNGHKMEIVGRIDRVDQAVDERNRLLLRIVDYKSSDMDLDLTKVYYGLALQMLTYLDVIITYARDWLGSPAEPAGVLYFHVHNPLLRLPDKLSPDELEDELNKNFKMKGLLLADKESLLLMDKSVVSGASSIVPFAVKKDGEFKKSSSLASVTDFQKLREHTKRMIQQIGTKITDGDIRIAPFKLQNKTPCTYCPYRPVCRFDQSQSGNGFRLLKKKPDQTVLKELSEREGKKSDN
ncbi:helicase-exonuclease AddAB subunit AddB [Sporolactobacillus sp. THM7-4]|nr:helicase-exonuclease AddAB subunit AddB [Sporolactobacillus sp. THM7-4]